MGSNRSTCVLIGLMALASSAFAEDDSRAVEPVDFGRDVLPILSDACFQCHGPDEQAREADLRLDRRDDALADREGAPAVVPGDPGASGLFERISSTDPDVRMPPADSGRSLTAAQVATVRRWIEQGAEWREHWSFVTPVRPMIPAVGAAGWPRNEIDHFILARLEREGLTPASEAPRRTLARRVSLDLTGLTPTRQEVDAFLADDASGAYERLVDRLLSSPRFGERTALQWLDAARYADTHGYHEDYHRDMWPWRDWVIDALNENMPFDRFTIEQLAGDLLPEATNRQLVATGFNRNHGVTASGISEEYRVEYALDRVNTTATVWLGLTLQCAQCHDHKYDPISQKDYYRLFAYFNTITDKGVENREGNVDPLINVVGRDDEDALSLLLSRIAEQEADLRRRETQVGPDLAAWERSVRDDPQRSDRPEGLLLHYRLDETTGASAANAVADRAHGKVEGNPAWVEGKVFGALELDGKTFVDAGDSADFERTDAFSYGAWVHGTGSGGAIITRMDDAAAYRGFDLYATGDAVEVHLVHHWPDNAIHLRTKKPLPDDQWTHLFVSYDGSSKVAGAKLYVNGSLQETTVTQDGLTGTIRHDKRLRIGSRNPSGRFTGKIDDVRVYDRELTADEIARLAADDGLEDILAIAPAQRTPRQRQALARFYLRERDPEYVRVDQAVAELRREEQALRAAIASTTVMVMREMEQPRDTFVLVRGQYDQHGDRVESGTPTSLPPSRESSPGNRLGLARWLVRPDHPLTARVAVNRLWQLAFGAGIVRTAEDFGAQGERPSHPELLDWLATEFVRQRWDVKRMLRLIVISATYRQSSGLSTGLSSSSDPDNRLLGRGPRYRLDAESIRDNALAVSGLLVERTGGSSVKPYQPAGLWLETSNRPYGQDHGEKLYRRSLYTYWKRSVPPPNLFAIDAPTRETCLVRRQRTNTPMMALVLLNDPTFVEAARHLAERALREAGPNLQDRIRFAFLTATCRDPKPAELGALTKAYRRQHEIFEADRPAAEQLLGVGESARDERLDAIDCASMTAVANIILSLDETISKE